MEKLRDIIKERCEEMGREARLSKLKYNDGVQLKLEQLRKINNIDIKYSFDMLNAWYAGWHNTHCALILIQGKGAPRLYEHRNDAEGEAKKRLKSYPDTNENFNINIMFCKIDQKIYYYLREDCSLECDMFDTDSFVATIHQPYPGISEEERWLNSRGCL
jgi:hypothetical protein